MLVVLLTLMLFSNVFVMYPKAQVSAERIEELLSSESLIKDPEKGVTETNNEGTLEFNDVTFVYPDGEEAVIKNVSFKAKKGETIAFIGSTGSGKSTLINLIPRFYDVTNGSIKIDGVDVRDFTCYQNNAIIAKLSSKKNVGCATDINVIF